MFRAQLPLAVLLVLAACHDSHPKVADAPLSIDAAPDAAAAPNLVEVGLIPALVNRDVDLLFVVDDSPNTLDKQENLRHAFPTFVNTLTAVAGGLPNLHIGVVTSDVGTKGAEEAHPGPAVGAGPGACSGTGKDGTLQTEGATQIAGAFIIDVGNPDSTRSTNYNGTLADAFSAIALVGSNGCGFEQSIEAAKLALNGNPANAGFLRPTANLGIIFLTDEDDCSMSHSALIAANMTLGPLASFRCTRYGVTCDQGGTTTDEMNTPGVKSACHSNESDQYLTRIGDYVTFFKTLKADPRTILIAALAGDPTPVSVELAALPGGGTPIPTLANSCMYTGQDGIEVADPAVRINQLVGAFERHQFSSVCSADLTSKMSELAQQIGPMIGVPCLAQPIAQPPVCRVFDVTPGAAAVELPECKGGAIPCYTLAADATKCPSGQHMNVAVTRNEAPPAGSMVSVRCAL
jgi:hypothetical protein